MDQLFALPASGLGEDGASTPDKAEVAARIRASFESLVRASPSPAVKLFFTFSIKLIDSAAPLLPGPPFTSKPSRPERSRGRLQSL